MALDFRGSEVAVGTRVSICIANFQAEYQEQRRKGVAENDEACQGYADLVNMSQCDFVEIKGATFSPVWEKRNSGLSRDSIPRHDDVLQFARRLVSKLPMYGIAAEHERFGPSSETFLHVFHPYGSQLSKQLESQMILFLVPAFLMKAQLLCAPGASRSLL